MKPKLPSLAALLFAGALACTDEAIQPPAEEPSCREGRVWYRGACVDPAEMENETPTGPESCRPQAERVCIDRFAYSVDSCGILEQETAEMCSLYQGCRDGWCVDGETFFFDGFDSLDQWRVKGGTHAFVQDSLLEMSAGSIESREHYDWHLLDETHSLVLTYIARMNGSQMFFSSDGCYMRDDGRAGCWSDEVQTPFDPREWHVYTIRLETIPAAPGYRDMDVTFAIDNQVVLENQSIRVGVYNLILFICRGDAGTTCGLDSVHVQRPDHW